MIAHRHAFVGEPQAFRAPRIDGLAGQQQVERGGRADEPRQALDAAPAGNDPQHHFGEAEPRSRLVDDDAIPARKGQFQAAPQTETANERQRRILDVSEPLERVPAALDDRDRAGLVLHVAEFVDIGAGNEAVRLAGTYHQTLRRIAIEEVECLVQFGQHCGGQRIDRGARFVERESREAIGVASDGPMLHRRS